MCHCESARASHTPECRVQLMMIMIILSCSIYARDTLHVCTPSCLCKLMSALVARSQERARLAARLGAAWRVRLKGPTAADGRHAKPRVVRPNCSVSRLSFYASLFLWYCTHVRCFYPGQLEPAQNPIEISLMLRCCKHIRGSQRPPSFKPPTAAADGY